MKWLGAIIAVTVMTLSSPAVQADGFAGEISGANVDHLWGGELGASYRIGVEGFHITPTLGALIYKGDNQRYLVSAFSNGQTRCRDTINGQFAKTSLCSDAAVAGYGRIEVTYGLPKIEVGGGVRMDSLSQTAQPYGTVAFSLTPEIGLKANAGKDYYALGVTFGY